MRSLRLRTAALLLLASCAMTSCATQHLFRWARGEQSLYHQPLEKEASFVRPAGTVLVLPVAVAWDIVTFPFQWLWDVYPYGAKLSPDTLEVAPDKN
ncbi:MAG: hypothetical protein H6834_00735 [Planctomycetes bacterium]|nr:hypothetical protein [Planctomycetota bacterium]